MDFPASNPWFVSCTTIPCFTSLSSNLCILRDSPPLSISVICNIQPFTYLLACPLFFVTVGVVSYWRIVEAPLFFVWTSCMTWWRNTVGIGYCVIGFVNFAPPFYLGKEQVSLKQNCDSPLKTKHFSRQYTKIQNYYVIWGQNWQDWLAPPSGIDKGAIRYNCHHRKSIRWVYHLVLQNSHV